MWEGIADKISGIFEGLIQFLYDSFVKPFENLPTLKNLIFGRSEAANGEELIWTTFTSNDLNSAYTPLYYTMMSIAGCFFVAFIVIGGMRIASSSINATRRNEMLEFTKDLILVGLSFYFLPLAYALVFEINQAVVTVFSGQYESQLDSIKKPTGDGGGVIGWIAIQLILLGLGIWANFYYMMRKITLIILMSMGPLMMVFWLMPQFKAMTGAWFKELIGTVFVQSIHAFVFWTIAVLSATATDPIATIIVYVVFIPISESIRGLLGMGGNMNNGLSKAGAMFGMSALAGVAGAAKGAFEGKSVMGALKGMKNGVSGTKSGKNGEGADGEVPGANGSVAGEGEKNYAASATAKMLKAGEIGSKGGKAVFGAAGAIAGSGLGPVGALAGAEIGSMIGGVSGGVGLRVGAAAAMGVANRFKAGQESLNDLKNARGSEDGALTEAVAGHQANTWANDNKEKMMSDLQQKFPNATPQDIEKKFNDMKRQKQNEYKTNASAMVQSAKQNASKSGNGEALVEASATSMANQWANENRDAFMSDYEEKEPRKPGESNGTYLARKSNAFNQRVAGVKDQFKNDGQKYLDTHAGPTGLVAREGVATFMSDAAGKHQGIGNVANLESAARSGMEHVQGAELFNKAGKPNATVITNSLAAVKTANDAKSFIASKTAGANPVSHEQAQTMWKQQEQEVHANNIKSFEAPNFQNQLENAGVKPIPANKFQAVSQNAQAFMGGAAGINGIKQFGQQINAGATMGAQAYQESLENKQIFKAIPNVISAANQGMANQHIQQAGGDAVLAQKQFTDKAGFGGALVLGRTGLRMAQGGATRISSPYTQAVQNQIASPSEVMGMAQTMVDDNGNTQIAKGAIRQVVTRDASYVEVRTNSGEVRTVSRMGAGSESLKAGETIYQDLAQDGDALVVSSGPKNGPATYKVDSGGARIHTPIAVNSNHNSLLGNPAFSNQHAPVQNKEIPVFNQQVDAGNFFTEDVAEAGFSEAQVIVDKGRQFVTGKRDGTTYRISPIYAGDSRLQVNETVSIPVKVEAGQLKPVKTNGQFGLGGTIQQNAVQQEETVVQQVNMGNNNGTRQVVRNVQTVIVKNENINDKVHYNDMYDKNAPDNLGNLLQSKHGERAERSVNRRQNRDVVGRKQGILG